MKNIIVIGGGTGTFVVLSSLKNYPVNLKAIVSMADTGGSTGKLRDEYGVLPPGDVRQCLSALSQTPLLRDLFNFRFRGGSLAGHNFGNIFLTALEKVTGSFKEAVLASAKILNVKGQVLPSTLDKINLCVKLENKKRVCGESNIDEVRGWNGNLRIKKAYLSPKGRLTKEAKEALITADAIIFGPGDLFTSIIPNLLLFGFIAAMKNSKAKKIYVCNLMTKFGQTNGFTVSDHVREVERYLGKKVLDFVLYNKKRPPSKISAYYKKEKEFFVEPDPKNFSKKIKFIGLDLLNKKIVQAVSSDVLRRSLIRHDPIKLAHAILKII